MLANIIRNSKKTVGGGGGGIVIDGGDPYYSAVSLMLSMDGTNGSTTFTDSSLNALTVTPVGNAQISTTQSKYGGASAYFDGSGDYLNIPYSSSFDITTDYTIEFWMRSDSVSGYAPIFTLTSASLDYFAGIYVVRNGSTITFETRPADGSGSTIAAITGGSISVNTWYHVAASVSSNAAKLFINGVQVGSTTTFASRTFTPTGARIGRFANNYTSGLVDFQGYIDDLRISRFARYVSNFTPPTAALPTTASSTVADPYYNYTSLLLHMDGTNASTAFVDSGPNALAVTAVGNAQISTGQSKYGGASGYFDGTGDYLQISNNTVFDLPGDFTVEAWFYASNLGSSPCIAGKWVANNVSWALIVGTASATFAVGNNGSYVASLSFSTTLTNNTWYHIAATRSGSSIKCFINGSQIGSTQTNSSNCSSTSIFAVGFLNSSSPAYFQGYIDDLRITKYARYTSAFTPPTSAYPNA